MPDHESCLTKHIIPLKERLASQGLEVYSEHGEGGWVNVYCSKCICTHEVYLRPDRDIETGERFDDEECDDES